jgi:L-rhamnose-H+ transport protein
MHNTTAGLILLIAAGVMNASFSLPMKFTRKWAWENTWLVWSVYALLLLPAAVALLTIPHLGSVYQHAGSGIIIAVALFGAGWGVAQVLFGLALEVIGIALTFSIVLGLSAAMGSLIPLVRLHRDQMFTASGLTAIAGILLVLAGVAVCAVAGRMRESAQAVATRSRIPFMQGLAMAIASGICASMMNFGVAFGGPLIAASSASGTKSYFTVNSIWLPLMLGGAIPNLAYCIYLMRRNQTSGKFAGESTRSYWALAFVMACFWFGSSLLYGAAISMLGNLGAVLGWPLFMSLIVIIASLLGVLTGEWKSAGPKPLSVQITAVMILVVAVVVLSRASL